MASLKPCQPYSVAGKRGGKEDDRAIWPEIVRLLREMDSFGILPTWCLFENVPGLITMELDRCLSDLEAIGYSCRPFVVPACAVDAKHRRDRVWIVAHNDKLNGDICGLHTSEVSQFKPADLSGRETVANANSDGWKRGLCQTGPQQHRDKSQDGGEALANASGSGLQERNPAAVPSGSGYPAGCNDSGRAIWLPEPDVGRVASRVPNRAHRLRGLGNAIVPQVAEEFIRMMIQSEKYTQKDYA